MLSRAILVLTAAAAISGCGYPETKLEPVSPTQSQMQSQTAPDGTNQAKQNKAQPAQPAQPTS